MNDDRTGIRAEQSVTGIQSEKPIPPWNRPDCIRRDYEPHREKFLRRWNAEMPSHRALVVQDILMTGALEAVKAPLLFLLMEGTITIVPSVLPTFRLTGVILTPVVFVTGCVEGYFFRNRRRSKAPKDSEPLAGF